MALVPGFYLPASFIQHPIRDRTDSWIRRYVKVSLSHTELINETIANQEACIWKKVMIYNAEGKHFLSKESYVNVAYPPIFSNVPDAVILLINGAIKVYTQEDLTFWQISSYFLNDVWKTYVLAETGLAFLGKPPISSGLIRTLTDFKGWITEKYKLIDKLWKAYQVAASRISTILHIQFLRKVDKLGRAIIPDYHRFRREQESYLSDLSWKIFGDSDKLCSYVHIAEMLYRIEIQNAKASKDEKREAAALHSANVMHNIIHKLYKYRRDPLAVWHDIYFYTFDEGNKYCEEKGVYEGEVLFADLAALGERVETVHSRLTQFGMFAKELENVGLDTMITDIAKITNDFNTFYKDDLRPAFRVVNEIVNKQQQAIAAIEAKLNADLKARARSVIITSDPDTLNPRDKIIQNNQFIKMLNNAIPGIDKTFDFNTIDIGDLYHE